MGPPGTPGPKGETGPKVRWVVYGGCGREKGGVTVAVLVGTKLCAQCLEKPGTSTAGRPCLDLSPHVPTLTEFPRCRPQRRPGSQEQSSRLLSHLEMRVTSCTAEEMVPAEHTLSRVSPMCSFSGRSGLPRHAGLCRPHKSQRRERCPQ